MGAVFPGTTRENQPFGRDGFHTVPDHFTGFTERLGMHATLKLWRAELRSKTVGPGVSFIRTRLHFQRGLQ
jgi:hypothetical protein